MKLEGQTILIVSNEAWGTIWYSKHNYAYELSKKNTVYFINPTAKWCIWNIFKNKIQSEKISPNLNVVSYNNALPANEKRALIFRLNEWIVSKRLKRYFNKTEESALLFWSFDPFRLIDPAVIGCKMSIFHYADNYTNESLKKLLSNCDYILCISDEFASSPLVKAKPHLVLNHSVPDNFFEDADKEILPSTLNVNNYILFIGHLDFRLDFNLIEKWLVHFKEYQFAFVGPIKNDLLDDAGKRIFEEKRYDNVIIVGSVPFKDLKHYIAFARVTIAPMREDVHGNQINHQKLLQYLAWGKPVVCSLFNDYNDKRHLIYAYESSEESMMLLNAAYNEGHDSDKQIERIKFSKEFSFSKQFEKIEKLIS